MCPVIATHRVSLQPGPETKMEKLTYSVWNKDRIISFPNGDKNIDATDFITKMKLSKNLLNKSKKNLLNFKKQLVYNSPDKDAFIGIIQRQKQVSKAVCCICRL